MLKQRFLVVLFLLPIGIWAIVLGGLYFSVLMAIFIGLAAWEYAKLFKAGDFEPSSVHQALHRFLHLRQLAV